MARVLVPLAEGFEEMEGIIIVDVLRRAELEVITASLNEGPITASRGTRHLADTTIEAAADQDFDMVVLPGGAVGAANLEKNPVVADILRKMKSQNRYIAAICAAPNVLRNLGILGQNDPFTVHPATLETGRGGSYQQGQRVVFSGRTITSVGPGSAFEFALALVEQICGPEMREQVAGPMHLPAG